MTAFLLMLFTIAGKLAALAKDIVFASLFGVSPETDAYFIANQVPGILWLAIFGTITSVFAPIYVRLMGDTVAATRFVNEAVRFYVYVALALTLISLTLAGPFVTIAAPSFDASTHDLAVMLTRIMVMGFALTGYVGVQSAVQQAHRHFVPPVAVPVINNLLVIGAIFLAYRMGSVAIAVIGAVGAYLVQCVIQRMQTRRLYTTQWGLSVHGDTWRRLSLLSGPVVFAVMLDQCNIFIGNSIASGFGPGAISHLNYASRLALFVAGFFSWLVSYMFFPALASHAAREDDRANADVLTRALAIILVTTAPAATAAIALRADVITLIYRRGAFAEADVTATAMLFGLLGLGILFISVRELLNRLFFSYQRTSTPLFIGLVAAAINLGCSVLLSRVMGINGIAAGAAIAAIAFAMGQVIMIWTWKPALLTRRLWAYGLAVLLASGVAFLTDYVTLPHLANWPLLPRLMAGGTIVLSVYTPTFFLLMRLQGVFPGAVLAQLTGPAGIAL